MLWRDLLRGGITVDTPEGAPRLRSVIQFDGDIQTLVAGSDFDVIAADPAQLHGLIAQHQQAIAARLKALAAVQRVGTWLHYGTWALTGTALIAMAKFGAADFLSGAAPAACPMVLRYALAWALPGLLKLSLGQEKVVMADTHREVEKLQARRGVRT